jgi:C_GCAxxG_C_C family probable redox protein
MEKTINGHTRREALELAFTLGFESEKNRHSCSQSSFHAITAVLGCKNPVVFKSLAALQGGGADSGLNSCGAFCGALVAFSLFFGRDYALWESGKMELKASILGEKILEKFQEAYGSAICKDIHMYGLGFATRFVKDGKRDQQAIEKFEEHGGHTIVAPTVVGRAAAWAVDLLWDELPKDQDIPLEGIPTMENAGRALEANRKPAAG